MAAQAAVTIRPRTDEDLPQCIDVLRAVYEKDHYPVQGVQDALPFLKGHDIKCGWVAEVNGQIVGHVAIGRATRDDVAVALWQKQYPPGHLAVLERLFVHPSHRGLRIAAQLINHANGWATETGVQLVLFALAKDTTAIRLYERLGWAHFGTAAYLYGDGKHMDALCFASPYL